MSNNPYSYDLDDFDESASGMSGDSYEYAGHIFSETKPCTKCKAFHYLPGLKNIDDQFSEYVSAILREFVRKFELENKVYASAIFMGMMALTVNRMDFQFHYSLHKNSVIIRSIAEKNEDSSLKIPLEDLIKIHRAEMVLVVEAYRKNIIGIFDNLTKSKLAELVYKNKEAEYIASASKFFSGVHTTLRDTVLLQYKELCNKYNYLINESYLELDVANFKPRNELDRLYNLENVRSIIQDIVSKIFDKKGP